MSRVRGSLDIARPVEVVFDVVADQRNEPSYNPSMTAATTVTEGPIAVGTRFDATLVGRGTPRSVTVEYTSFERGMIGRRERTIWTALKLYLEGTGNERERDGRQRP